MFSKRLSYIIQDPLNGIEAWSWSTGVGSMEEVKENKKVLYISFCNFCNS